MDEELQQLEDELRALRPRRLPAELMTRTEAALQTPEPPASRARLLPWIGAVLAVAAALAFVLRMNRPVPTAVPAVSATSVATAPGVPSTPKTAAAPDDRFRPVAARNLLLESRDEGLVTLDDGTQARRSRKRYLDTVTWKNPRTNASVSWTVPREDVQLTPVAFQ